MLVDKLILFHAQRDKGKFSINLLIDNIINLVTFL